jgi:uncharacterized protein YyaL (SSP411 family)
MFPSSRASNRLAHETSPYLLQHAHNPVEWYPWGDEAFERARSEDRPVLLSVGYSACHWCHVMERESFEDPEVARLMNELFVNIKVDREERPDIDQVYMKAVQAMTGSGGWPLTAWLTPEGVPYYGGTYFPPEPRHGLPSFSQVLRAVADAYQNRREEVEAAGARLLEAIDAAARSGPEDTATPPSEDVQARILDGAYRALARQYDARNGGFGAAPRFPQPITLEILLRHHVRTGERSALEMLVHTLRRMAAGGLQDHLAGGFHRYSVDAHWLVPHFEKMLYDNALLARIYLDAYRVTGEEDLRAVAERTLEYLVADMLSPEGGFYTARDADSEGEEGRYYVWTAAEVEEVLGDDARTFMRAYDVTPGGNFEGRNILHLPHDIPVLARAVDRDPAELEAELAASRARLLEARRSREEPQLDDKILVSWNAMAIRAFAEAGACLGRPDFVAVAERAAELLWTELRRSGRLLHTYRDGVAKIPGFLEDYAALGNALLSLHGATLDARWLEGARWACGEVLTHFQTEGTLFDTAVDAEALVIRPRDAMDNATPSGTSLAAELFVRVGHALDEEECRRAAEQVFEKEAPVLARFGPAYGRLLSALDRSIAEPVEIVIVGARDDAATGRLVRAAHRRFVRNLTVVGRHPDEPMDGVPLLEDRHLSEGRPAAYICRGYTCRLPVTAADAVVAEIDALSH